MRTYKNAWLLMGVMAAMPVAANAAPIQTINFDDVLPGTVINDSYTASNGVSFVGEGGTFFTNVQAIDTTSVSAPNSLDATLSLVDINFDPGTYAAGINDFSITLVADPAGFGSTDALLSFYDINGGLLGTLTGIDQTQTQTLSFNGIGVQKVVLASDAYYDNLNFSAVPEPGSVASLGTGLLALAGLAIRRRRRA